MPEPPREPTPPLPAPQRSVAAALVARVASALVMRPGVTIVVVVALLAISAHFARGIAFDTRLSGLLPESAPEVREMELVRSKLGGTVELVVAVGGPPKARFELARELVKRLRALPEIRWAELEYPNHFFVKRRVWFLTPKKLDKLAKDVEVEIQRAKARANPFYVDLEDDDDKKGSKKDKKKKAWQRVEDTRRAVSKQLARIYESKDGRWLFLRVKPKVGGADMQRGVEILTKVKRVVAELEPARRRLVVRYAGAMPVNVEQHQRMTHDIRRASLYALVLVLLLTTLYIRRLAAPVVLALPLVVGIAATLAITALTIGQLNLVSGFLVSALIGMGIDFGVHLYLRFIEELSKIELAMLEQPLVLAKARRDAMIAAFCNTFPGCFTAAATTAAAFLSMTISDFRGFREYGQIASFGVLLTLVATFIAVPPVALLLTRVRRRSIEARIKREQREAEAGGASERSGFTRRAAKFIVVAAAAFVAFALVVLPKVGWHNDFKKLRGKSDAVDFYEYVQEQLGASLSPTAVMVRTLDEARRVAALLKRKRDSKGSRIKRVLSLADMMPSEIAKKQPILARIAKSLRGLLRNKRLKPADRKHAQKALQLVTVAPWKLADIPAPYRRRFVSLDGKNMFVFAWSSLELYLDAELFAWADYLKGIEKEIAAMGVKAVVLEENRTGARAVRETRREWPYVFAYALVAVVIVLLIDFRSPRKVALMALALAVGFGWIVGGMWAADISLNIFNQCVLPTILGIGIDNAVHMQHRYDAEGFGSVPRVLATTGAAAFLASATTAIGFGSTVTAHHYGVNTFGWLAIIGIGATFVASTVFFLSLLRLLERKRADAAGK